MIEYVKKIAICIPSYNESKNIKNISTKIDKALSFFDDRYYSVIVNCDNNSPDGTNAIFRNLSLKHEKVSIVTNKKGKGENIYNFFKYFSLNNFDYGFMIDSDLKSFEDNWIIKMMNLLENGYNFIFPVYKRKKEEGNTTNHFISPVLYKLYGKFIRQPIGGDYGFDLSFVELVLQKEFTKNILNYGIDVLLASVCITSNINYFQLDLGEKIHNSSYLKMEDIFESVLKGFAEVYKQIPIRMPKEKINYKSYFYENNNSFFFNDLDKKYYDCLDKCNLKDNYHLILKEWSNYLEEYINNIYNLTDEFIENGKNLFICRSISFWKYIDKKKCNKWEDILIKELY